MHTIEIMVLQSLHRTVVKPLRQILPQMDHPTVSCDSSHHWFRDLLNDNISLAQSFSLLNLRHL